MFQTCFSLHLVCVCFYRRAHAHTHTHDLLSQNSTNKQKTAPLPLFFTHMRAYTHRDKHVLSRTQRPFDTLYLCSTHVRAHTHTRSFLNTCVDASNAVSLEHAHEHHKPKQQKNNNPVTVSLNHQFISKDDGICTTCNRIISQN